jgi:anaerobic magnesium-protoporphyrin IX monomethyl ester cyclase
VIFLFDILLVNPYLFPIDLRGKEEWGSNHAVNFGLLSLASYLVPKGMVVEIFDTQEGKESIKKLINIVKKEKPLIVGIGCVSSLSFIPTVDIAKAIKQASPETFIIVGGQHTCFFPEELLNKELSIDAVAVNESEETLVQLVDSLKNKKNLSSVGGVCFRKEDKIVRTKMNPRIDLNDLPDTDYSLYPDYKNFFPLIEESRGCGFKCAFCTNQNFYAEIRFKSGEKVFAELKRTMELYGSNDLPVVLQCSNYGYNLKESEKLFSLIKKSGLHPQIMISSRVDGPWRQFIKWTKPYLDQMRFGLESGSPETLVRMKKTSDPKHYLKMASNAFKTFHDKEITTITNVLYGFCGDTQKNLSETNDFLSKNKENISCVRAHPLMDFPGSPYSVEFDIYKEKYGSSREVTKFSDLLKTYPINPTLGITFDDMLKQSHKLMQELNSFDGYYEYYKWTSPAKSKNNKIGFYNKNSLLSDIKKSTVPENQDFHF